MMLAAPFKCDYCDKRKEDSNHWWMRDKRTVFFALLKWDDRIAAYRELPDDPTTAIYEHICGQACALKALAKWMAA